MFFTCLGLPETTLQIHCDFVLQPPFRLISTLKLTMEFHRLLAATLFRDHDVQDTATKCNFLNFFLVCKTAEVAYNNEMFKHYFKRPLNSISSIVMMSPVSSPALSFDRDVAVQRTRACNKSHLLDNKTFSLYDQRLKYLVAMAVISHFECHETKYCCS